jgi:cysteine desulfurase/selenocysteine lyase
MVTDRPSKLSAAALARLRADFPILAQQVNDHPLAYLDNAATAQKPRAVMDALVDFYQRDNANIHRGVHALSQRSTDAYEDARRAVAGFIGAADPGEIVFVRGSTEGINLVAACLGRARLRAGDRILLTAMEHHANIVPWQLLAQERGLAIDVAPVHDNGELDLAAWRHLLAERQPKLVAFVHASNALGTINPAAELVAAARAAGALTLVDGAQAVTHFPVDVRALGCDFYVCSGHKLFAPTGIGVLYGRAELLAELPPYQGGGDMIEKVSFAGTTFRGPPERFEAGTPDIAGVIGLAAALRYLQGLDRPALAAHEDALRLEAEAGLGEIPGLRIIGTAAAKVSVVSFVLKDAHPHDIGSFLDAEGIAIRTGHHCAQPLMDRLGIPGTARASFAFYNTAEEVDRLVRAVWRVQRIFS